MDGGWVLTRPEPTYMYTCICIYIYMYIYMIYIYIYVRIHPFTFRREYVCSISMVIRKAEILRAAPGGPDAASCLKGSRQLVQ